MNPSEQTRNNHHATHPRPHSSPFRRPCPRPDRPAPPPRPPTRCPALPARAPDAGIFYSAMTTISRCGSQGAALSVMSPAPHLGNGLALFSPQGARRLYSRSRSPRRTRKISSPATRAESSTSAKKVGHERLRTTPGRPASAWAARPGAGGSTSPRRRPHTASKLRGRSGIGSSSLRRTPGPAEVESKE